MFVFACVCPLHPIPSQGRTQNRRVHLTDSSPPSPGILPEVRIHAFCVIRRSCKIDSEMEYCVLIILKNLLTWANTSHFQYLYLHVFQIDGHPKMCPELLKHLWYYCAQNTFGSPPLVPRTRFKLRRTRRGAARAARCFERWDEATRLTGWRKMSKDLWALSPWPRLTRCMSQTFQDKWVRMHPNVEVLADSLCLQYYKMDSFRKNLEISVVLSTKKTPWKKSLPAPSVGKDNFSSQR